MTAGFLVPGFFTPALETAGFTVPLAAVPAAGVEATMAFLVVFRELIKDFFWIVIVSSSRDFVFVIRLTFRQ